MIDAILNWLSFSLEARYYIRARDVINAYTRSNDIPSELPMPLNVWAEYFEAENEARKSIMKAIISGELISKEDFENLTRATMWYCQKEKSFNDQNKKGGIDVRWKDHS